jgi:hypothetical protein
MKGHIRSALEERECPEMCRRFLRSDFHPYGVGMGKQSGARPQRLINCTRAAGTHESREIPDAHLPSLCEDSRFVRPLLPRPNRHPTGNVTFLDGTTSLGTATVNTSGIATLSIATLVAGTHLLTASYAGDANHFPASNAPLTQMLVDFSVSSASMNTATINPGGSASYSITLGPVIPATTLPGPITLSASGGPAGATYTSLATVPGCSCRSRACDVKEANEQPESYASCASSSSALFLSPRSTVAADPVPQATRPPCRRAIPSQSPVPQVPLLTPQPSHSSSTDHWAKSKIAPYRCYRIFPQSIY